MSNPRRRHRSDSFYDSSADDSPLPPNSVIALDRGIHFSEDRRFAYEEGLNPRIAKRHVSPSAVAEFASWKCVDDYAETSSDFDAQMSSNEDDVEVDPDADVGQKRKRYPSDDPLSEWKACCGDFIDEFLRLEGPGDGSKITCATCLATHQPFVRIFRCKECNLQECLECALKRHSTLPLHILQEWTGFYWENISLKELGLVYQLGHGGLSCPFPDPMLRTMAVFDTTGVHHVRFRYCQCQLVRRPSSTQQLLRNSWYPATVTNPATCATFRILDTFRLLNVVGNTNAYDFIRSIERLTSTSESISDRSPVFGRMAREFAFLLRLKRSGVGQDFRGLDCIPYGALAVECWACPHDGKNLPEGWRNVDPKHRYLYMIVLAIDANFRLKNRIRPNERNSTAICPGSAYFVDVRPYKEFLLNYVSEKDASSCIAFAALLQKDTRVTHGLRTSGVVGCACARHELVRRQGMGDLQKGERYANVDYIFFSAIQDLHLLEIGASYDICCQWKATLWDRMFCLPPQLHLKTDVSFTFGLPTWHAVVHKQECRSENALVYQDGVGRTDGEGIERIWSILNPSAWSTKEMTEGSRHDFLDDKIDGHNHNKNIGLGNVLLRRVKVAEEQKDSQEESFQKIDSALSPATQQQWKRKVDVWKSDRSNPNPYVSSMEKTQSNCEAEARLFLAAEETKSSLDALGKVRGTSPLAFITSGLDLEEAQQKLLCDLQDTENQQAPKIYQRRMALLAKLKSYRDLQHIYMPAAIRHTQQDVDEIDVAHAEKVKVMLPSDVPEQQRAGGCMAGLSDIEIKLRSAQCSDALASLRRDLRTKQHLIFFRDANAVGQDQSTRSRSLIDRVGDAVKMSVSKYRRARAAIASLRGDLSDFRELTDDDVALDKSFDSDSIAVARLVAAGIKSKKHKHISTGTKTISWIWTGCGGPQESEGEIVEAVEVEWAKALARRDRWTEEVSRLKEEMKCVLRYLSWRAAWWEASVPSDGSEDALTLGRRAYAARQAAILRRIADRFSAKWSDYVDLASLDALPQ